MKLDDAQRQQVSTWIAEGLQIGDIQKRLDRELGIRMTYMEVRFLFDDLQLLPKDVEKAAPQALPNLAGKSDDARGAGPKPAAPETPSKPATQPLQESEAAGFGNVSVTVDRVTRPGAMVSGQVQFSDGKTATWYLDQMGRLGLAPKEPGYKPSAADLQSFQAALESELSKMGY